MLTLLATGIQEQDMDTPWEPNDRPVEEMITISEVSSLRAPVSRDMPTRKPSRQTSREGQKQSTTSEDDPRCKETKHRLERAEWSLLFLTAAGAVCQIGDCEWYGMCVLTLALLAKGVQAKEGNKPQGLREKRAAFQEVYRLEVYDCSEPEDAIVYLIPQQCPETEEQISLPELSGMT